jgi:NIMA (never in mitosis gene a)-related kinase
MNELYQKVTKGSYPDIPKHFSKDLSRIIGYCLQVNPQLRPTPEELLKMPVFNNGEEVDKKPMHRRANSQ